jgi:hypothetical protein
LAGETNVPDLHIYVASGDGGSAECVATATAKVEI